MEAHQCRQELPSLHPSDQDMSQLCSTMFVLSYHRLASSGAKQPQTQVKPWTSITFPPFKSFLSGVRQHRDKTLRTHPLSEVSLVPQSPLSCAECQGFLLCAPRIMCSILSTDESVLSCVTTSPYNLDPSDSVPANRWVTVRHLFLLSSWAVPCFEPKPSRMFEWSTSVVGQQVGVRKHVPKSVTCWGWLINKLI